MCDRGPGDFPAPVARRQSSDPLWSWTEVEAWFARYDPEAVPALGLRLSPDFIAEVNDRLGLRERLRHSPNAPWRPGSACCWFQQSRFEFSRQSAVPQRWREPLPFTPGGHSSPGRCSPCQPKQDHGTLSGHSAFRARRKPSNLSCTSTVCRWSAAVLGDVRGARVVGKAPRATPPHMARWVAGIGTAGAASMAVTGQLITAPGFRTSHRAGRR
jgi:hypothetical protein